MSQKPRRTFTDEQKPEVVKIVEDSGKPIPFHSTTLLTRAIAEWIGIFYNHQRLNSSINFLSPV